MDTKDFILLMMMPLLLIGLIFYVDLTPSITGFATADDKESNILGVYSIKPSFRAKVDYSLSEYEQKQNELLEILNECAKLPNLEDCINKKKIERI